MWNTHHLLDDFLRKTYRKTICFLHQCRFTPEIPWLPSGNFVSKTFQGGNIRCSIPYANHGAGICTPTFARTKSPSHVGKYTMEHMGMVKISSGILFVITVAAHRRHWDTQEVWHRGIPSGFIKHGAENINYTWMMGTHENILKLHLFEDSFRARCNNHQ